MKNQRGHADFGFLLWIVIGVVLFFTLFGAGIIWRTIAVRDALPIGWMWVLLIIGASLVVFAFWILWKIMGAL